MTTRVARLLPPLAVPASVVVAVVATVHARRATSYALAGWPSDEQRSVPVMWATWAMAAVAATASALSPAPRRVRDACVAAAMAMVVEEGELPIPSPAWLVGLAALGGAVRPSLLASLVQQATATIGTESTPPSQAGEGADIKLVVPDAARRNPALRAGWVLVVAACAGVVGALLIDPSRHGCSACRKRPWQLADSPATADALARLGIALAVLGALASTLGAVARVAARRATPPACSIVAAAGGWLSLVILARDRLSGALETATGPARTMLALGLVVVAGAALWPRIDTARRRSRLVRAVARTASHRSTDIQAALRRALRDPSLLVAYPLEDGTLVDVRGAPVSLDGLLTTTVERDGGRVAVLAGTRPFDEGQLDVGVALAWPVLTHEREAAHLAANAQRLAAARRTSVEAADRERRLIERDLHDHAQQQLVSLMIGLRVGADRSDDPSLDIALVDVQAALDDIRRIAHGDLPAVLVEEGLPAALSELARDVPGSVVLVGPGCERMHAAVQSTVYIVVAAACLRQSDQSAAGPTVEVRVADDVVRISADHVQMHENDDVNAEAVARVRALGGSWSVHGDRLAVNVPCA